MGWLNKLYARWQLARRLPPHWRLRPRTLDRRIAWHVLVGNEYRLEKLASTDVVLDVGAHVGSFALAALRAGAGRVHCYEPDADNHRLLVHNLVPFGDRVCLHHAAVWRSDARRERLTLRNPHAARNTGALRVDVLDSEAGVDVVVFDEVVRELTGDGPLRLLKLDCEGAEWPILLTSRTLDRVEAICGEYHLGPLPAMYAVERKVFGVETLRRELEGQGFVVETEELAPVPHPCGLFFARRAGIREPTSRV